jgi:hypothetical protein
MTSYMTSPPEGVLDDEFPEVDDGACPECGALSDEECEVYCSGQYGYEDDEIAEDDDGFYRESDEVIQ